jgi:hypothetical protein
VRDKLELPPIFFHTRRRSVPQPDTTVQETTDDIGHNQKDNLKDYWWTQEQFYVALYGIIMNMTNSLTL